LGSREGFLASGTTGKLNGETLAFEFTPICVVDKQKVKLASRALEHTERCRKETVSQSAEVGGVLFVITRHNIPSIQCILIFNKAKPVH
jgi:hypothetical protein